MLFVLSVVVVVLVVVEEEVDPVTTTSEPDELLILSSPSPITSSALYSELSEDELPLPPSTSDFFIPPKTLIMRRWFRLISCSCSTNLASTLTKRFVKDVRRVPKSRSRSSKRFAISSADQTKMIKRGGLFTIKAVITN